MCTYTIHIYAIWDMSRVRQSAQFWFGGVSTCDCVTMIVNVKILHAFHMYPMCVYTHKHTTQKFSSACVLSHSLSLSLRC